MIKILKDYKGLSKNRTWLREKLKREISLFDTFTARQRAEIYRLCLELGFYLDEPWQELTFKKVTNLVNKYERKAEFKENASDVKEVLSSKAIFFACSSHGNPGEDHKEYQGKIYVDRFWRKKMSASPEWMIKAVEKYINKHQTISVQKIAGPPVYLGTRPYCRHKFIPLDTRTVLTTAADQLIPKFRKRRKNKKRRSLYD